MSKSVNFLNKRDFLDFQTHITVFFGCFLDLLFEISTKLIFQTRIKKIFEIPVSSKLISQEECYGLKTFSIIEYQ